MDSSVYKTMNGLSAFYPQNSEREREKLGPVSFWLRPLFASSVIFCELVIAGVLSIQTEPRPPIGQFRSRDRLAAFSLASSSKLLNSDCFHQLSKLNPEIENSRRKLYDRTMIKDTRLNSDLILLAGINIFIKIIVIVSTFLICQLKRLNILS